MKKLLMDLIELTQDAVFLFDAKGRLLMMNPAASEMFGYDPAGCENLKIEDLLNKKLGSLLKEIKEALRAQDTYKDEVVGTRATGETFAVEVHARYRQTEEASSLLVIAHGLLPVQGSELSESELNKKLGQLAYQAGIGQVATGVLHNVGNILNSINIGTQNLAEMVKDSKIPQLLKANALLRANLHQLQNFVETHPSGQLLPEYYQRVGRFLAHDNKNMITELNELQAHINLVKELIATQQDYAKLDLSRKRLNLAGLIDDAITIELLSLQKHDVTVKKDYKISPRIFADNSKILHVFLNLIKNAKEAMIASARKERILEIDIEATENGGCLVIIRDNGVGVSQSKLQQMFQYGFTTKLEGHGFGLYTSLRAMQELGGAISAHSEGPGQGTEFRLTFPSDEGEEAGS